MSAIHGLTSSRLAVQHPASSLLKSFKLGWHQCDQIGQFIGIWATFSKPLATMSLHKSPTFFGNFCKGVKIFNFSSKIDYWTTFIDIWRLFTGHTGWHQVSRGRILIQLESDWSWCCWRRRCCSEDGRLSSPSTSSLQRGPFPLIVLGR